MRGGAGDGPSMVTVPASGTLNVSTLLAERIATVRLTRSGDRCSEAQDETSIWTSSSIRIYRNLISGFVNSSLSSDWHAIK